MTVHDDLERELNAYLLEGPTELPYESFDAVRDRMDQTSQRAVIGPWRVPDMNKFLVIGAGAAAVVVVLLIGVQLIGSPTGGLGGPGEPTPTATPEPTPSPSAAEPSSAADGSLPEGPFLVQDAGASADAPRITVTIPAPGWTSLPDFGGLAKGPITDGPSQAAVLLWAWPVGTGFEVYGDPCQWKSTTPDTPVTTVDEIAAALAAQASRDASDPVDVIVNGYAGKKLTLHVPNDAAFAECDDGTFASYGVAGNPDPNRTHQGPGQVDEIWILNVNTAIAIIHVLYGPDTPAELIEEMRTIAESATFAW